MNLHERQQLPGPRRWRRALSWIAAASVLALVFIWYRNPHVVVDLANRVWACF